MFSGNLKILRKDKGLSQEVLAERLHVVRQTVSKWEKGLSIPDAEMLIRLAEELDTNVAALLGDTVEASDTNTQNAISLQLEQLNAQLAEKNRRSRRIWKVISIVLIAWLVFVVLVIVLNVMGSVRYVQTSGSVEVVPISADTELVATVMTAPEKAPQLELTFTEEGLSEQRIQAMQLTTSWYVVDENGDGQGYEADSPHPLQLRDYDEITFQLHSSSGSFVFHFTDDYPPQSISVQRWNAEHINEEFIEVWDNGEQIEADDNGFAITADGQDYIYEVYATWEQGNSRYAFRVEAAKK